MKGLVSKEIVELHRWGFGVKKKIGWLRGWKFFLFKSLWKVKICTLIFLFVSDNESTCWSLFRPIINNPFMQFFSICTLCMFFNLRFKWHDIHFNILVKSSLVEWRARVLFWKKVLTLFIKFTLKTIHSSFSYLDLSASKRFTCIKNMS